MNKLDRISKRVFVLTFMYKRPSSVRIKSIQSGPSKIWPIMDLICMLANTKHKIALCNPPHLCVQCPHHIPSYCTFICIQRKRTTRLFIFFQSFIETSDKTHDMTWKRPEGQKLVYSQCIIFLNSCLPLSLICCQVKTLATSASSAAPCCFRSLMLSKDTDLQIDFDFILLTTPLIFSSCMSEYPARLGCFFFSLGIWKIFNMLIFNSVFIITKGLTFSKLEILLLHVNVPAK